VTDESPLPSLSIVVPVFNEAATLERILGAVDERPEVSQIVIVDDGSSDGSVEIVQQYPFKHEHLLLLHGKNRGKGAAIRTGISLATGDVVLIQDADLEYDPGDYQRLLEPFRDETVKVVFGSRSFSSHTAYSFWFVLGNRLVTFATNLLFNTWISDMETCYKALRREVWEALDLRSDGFDIEPEITAKTLLLGHRVYEVPISYRARGRAEGKKLHWQDGVKALWVLARIRATWRPQSHPA
jgi:glycosyltransferase involved in cell wall biosynthesis